MLFRSPTKIHTDGRQEVIGGLDEQGRWHNPLLCAHPFAYGETFMFESTGGGGYGTPLERDPQQVLDDVLDEYISPRAARVVYGVVIDEHTLQVDLAATQAARAGLAVSA